MLYVPHCPIFGFGFIASNWKHCLKSLKKTAHRLVLLAFFARKYISIISRHKRSDGKKLQKTVTMNEMNLYIPARMHAFCYFTISKDSCFAWQGTTCPFDFAKLQFTCDKRQSSKSIYACGECPVNASDGDTFLTDGEWTQPSRRSVNNTFLV